MVAVRFICLGIGYLFGLFQTSYIVGRLSGIDIREHGSGNAGTTNTMRTLGRKAGVLVFVGDLVKTFLAVFVVWLLFRGSTYDPGSLRILQMYAGIGSVLGHIYPFYLKFRGGKGIASMGALALAVFLLTAPLCALVFVMTVRKTRYVSLASMLMLLTFELQLLAFGLAGVFDFPSIFHVGSTYLPELYLQGLFLLLLGVWKHRSNIVRLRNGTENKVKSRSERLEAYREEA